MGYQYANEMVDRFNSFHGYNFLLSPDPVPVPEFSAIPTDYTFLVGSGDDFTFDNPSVNDGRNVYSRVISEFDSPMGVPSQSFGLSGALAFKPATDISFTNPGFEVNTTGWILGGWARTTLDFATTPASVTVNTAGTAPLICSGFTGTMTIGKTYRCTFWAKKALATIILDSPYLVMGSFTYFPTTTTYAVTTSWVQYSFDFPALATTISQISINAVAPGVAASIWVDQFEFQVPNGNVIERRDFSRTALRPMASKSTAAAATALAQLELDSSQFPPLKGTLTVKGKIRVKGGEYVPVNRLPSCVGRGILIENFNDPNTGAFGRYGIIQTAEYDAATDTASVTIDANNNFIVNLRNRLQFT